MLPWSQVNICLAIIYETLVENSYRNYLNQIFQPHRIQDTLIWYLHSEEQQKENTKSLCLLQSSHHVSTRVEKFARAINTPQFLTYFRTEVFWAFAVVVWCNSMCNAKRTFWHLSLKQFWSLYVQKPYSCGISHEPHIQLHEVAVHCLRHQGLIHYGNQ